MGSKRKTGPGQRRQFTPEYKAEAVRLWKESGRPVAEIAAELGIGGGTLSRWGQQLGGKLKVVDVELTPEEELKRLRKRVRELEMEREILKKAAAFFAKESE